MATVSKQELKLLRMLKGLQGSPGGPGGSRPAGGGRPSGKKSSGSDLEQQLKSANNRIKQMQESKQRLCDKFEKERAALGMGPSTKPKPGPKGEVEGAAAATWTCEQCNLSHNDLNRKVCRAKDCKHPRGAEASAPPAPAKAPAKADAADANAVAEPAPSSKPTSPVDKNWGAALLQRNSAADIPAPSSDGDATMPQATESKEEDKSGKRQQLEAQLKALKASGGREEWIATLQAEIDALPASKEPDSLQDIGKLGNLMTATKLHHEKVAAEHEEAVLKAQRALEEAQAAVFAATKARSEHVAQKAGDIKRINDALAVARAKASKTDPDYVESSKAAGTASLPKLDPNADMVMTEIIAILQKGGGTDTHLGLMDHFMIYARAGAMADQAAKQGATAPPAPQSPAPADPGKVAQPQQGGSPATAPQGGASTGAADAGAEPKATA